LFTRMTLMLWSPLYMIEELHLDAYLASSFDSILNVGAVLGRFIIAPVVDSLVKRELAKSGTKSDNRRLIMARIPVLICIMVFYVIGMHLYCFHITGESTLMFIGFVALMIGVMHSGVMLIVS